MYENIYQILSLKYKKAFTLAEIMIALVVIGVITSILLPVAFNSVPDENVMKFKKGNATLAKVINELVTSGKYYREGDLGIKANGELIDGSHDDDVTYFCETIANLINFKNKNCSKIKNGVVDQSEYSPSRLDVLNKTQEEIGQNLDYECKTYTQAGAEIQLNNDLIMYQTSPGHTFGIPWNIVFPDSPEDETYWNSMGYRLFGCFKPDGSACFPVDKSEPFDNIYKIFCIDVDGIGKGEDPFGYGIRADGKILLGKRANEWLEKNIQNKD